MKRRFAIITSLAFLAITLCSCNPGNSADFSKATAQTGGPEQGNWRDKQNTLLSLSSGKFTYKKDDGDAVSGTYKVEGPTITLTPDSGSPIVAQMPDQNGPIIVDGETLSQMD